MLVKLNSSETPTSKDETLARSAWKKRAGELSVLELMDFDAYMRGTPEHRKGDFTTLRLNWDVPQQIIFFGENPEDEYLAHFELMEDRANRSIIVTCIMGDSKMLEPYLTTYGFEKVPESV